MANKSQISFFALTALLSAVLYRQGHVLKTFYTNHPTRFEEARHSDYTFYHDQRQQLRNCEDVVLSETERWAILSCDPGRDTWNTVMGTFVDPMPKPDPVLQEDTSSARTGLYIWRYDEQGAEIIVPLALKHFNPNPLGVEIVDDHTMFVPNHARPRNDMVSKNFHPLGIELVDDKTLFVSNHAFSGPSIEIFSLDIEASLATHVKTLKHPLIWTPNSIQALSKTEILITNDHAFKIRDSRLLATIETYLGLPTGSVTYLKMDEQFNIIDASTVTRLPFANGIARLNQTTVAIASSSMGSISLYDLQTGSGEVTLKPTSTIYMPFIPDNLTVDKRGVLWIAGHPHSISLSKVSQNARFCSPAALQQDATQVEWCEKNLRPAYLSWVATWTPEEGLTTIYASSDFGTSTTAVWDPDAGVGLVTGLYERGVLRMERSTG